MRRPLVFPALAAFVTLSATTAGAASIISGDGEQWLSNLAAVCAQVGPPAASCTGTTVDIVAHPAWKDDGATDPLASWVSYANTGYNGTVLTPRAGSAENPTGQTAIFEISESFIGLAGAPLFLRFWADDTMDVFFNGGLVKAAVFEQGTCAILPIGCETGEYWDLVDFTTGGLDTVRMVAYQVGTGTDPSSNPFGVLYSGTYTPGPAVPEPATLLLFGTGLAAAGVRRYRQQQK